MANIYCKYRSDFDNTISAFSVGSFSNLAFNERQALCFSGQSYAGNSYNYRFNGVGIESNSANNIANYAINLMNFSVVTTAPSVFATVMNFNNYTATTQGGGLSYTVQKITGTTTISATSGYIVLLVDCSNRNIVINLPTAIGNTAVIVIKKTDTSSHTLTIDPFSTQTIDGQLTEIILFKNTSITISSDNANWFNQ